LIDQALGVLAHDLAVDLGTCNTRVSVRGRGIAVEEPSVVAVRRGSGGSQVVAVGAAAAEMLGRTPEHMRAARPIEDGVIADFELAEVLLRTCIQAALGNRPLFKPRVVVSAPHGITEVESRAFQESVRAAGAREVTLVPAPVAAALGCELPIADASGCMVMDVGCGTTGIAILSLGGLVVTSSIRVGGARFDAAIGAWVKERHKVVISDRTAEQLKREVGSCIAGGGGTATVRGRDVATGIPREIRVTSDDMAQALAAPLDKLVEALRGVMDRATPEIAADVLEHGMVVCGGGALLRGFTERLRDRTGIPVILAEDPMRAVVLGAGKMLEQPELLDRLHV
jgi:rod shape-determining protein MreB